MVFSQKRWQLIAVFANDKHTADSRDDFFSNKGLPSTSIDSDRTQREREDALWAFKNGKASILIAIEVSARGARGRHTNFRGDAWGSGVINGAAGGDAWGAGDINDAAGGDAWGAGDINGAADGATA